MIVLIITKLSQNPRVYCSTGPVTPLDEEKQRCLTTKRLFRLDRVFFQSFRFTYQESNNNVFHLQTAGYLDSESGVLVEAEARSRPPMQAPFTQTEIRPILL